MRAANYEMVDLFKFIGSVFIFLMHLNIFGDYDFLRFSWELLTRWGVPFFFIISSFFLFSKEDIETHNIDKQTLIQYIRRIATLYLAWFIVNLPSVIYLRLLRPGIGQLNTWVSFIKSALLSSVFAGSWYLLSSMFSAFAIYQLSKWFNTKRCICLSVVPFILCLLTSAYGGLLPASISSVLKWFNFPLNICGGLLYFSLGKYISENIGTIQKSSDYLLLASVLLSVILLFIEIKLTIKGGIYWQSDYAIAILPFALCISIICLKSNQHIPHSRLLRKMSTIIYCAQGNILCAVSAAKFIGINSFLFKGLIGIAFMLVVVGVILYLQKDQKLGFVNKLT